MNTGIIVATLMSMTDVGDGVGDNFDMLVTILRCRGLISYIEKVTSMRKIIKNTRILPFTLTYV